MNKYSNDILDIDYGSTIDRTLPKGVKFNKENEAFTELRCKILELMIEFTSKYSANDENCIYPKTNQILVDIFQECLNEAKEQTGLYEVIND